MLIRRYLRSTDAGIDAGDRVESLRQQRIERLDLIDQVFEAERLVGGVDADILEALGRKRPLAMRLCGKTENKCCIGCSIGQRDRIRNRSKCPVSGVLITTVPPGLSRPRHRRRNAAGRERARSGRTR